MLGSRDLLEAAHEIEEIADGINHDIKEHLLEDFMVPMERREMSDLADALDDLVDSIEAFAMLTYMCDVTTLPPGADEMVPLLIEAVRSLAFSSTHLHAKKRKGLRNMLIRVQDIEGECDLIFLRSVRGLYVDKEMDPETRRVSHDVLSAIEAAVDRAEDVAERMVALVIESS